MFKNITPLFFALLTLLISLSSCSSEEDKAWKKAVKKNNLSAIDSFFIQYPNSKYKTEATKHKDRIEWAKAKRQETVYALKKYQAEHPQGLYLDSVPSYISNIEYNPIDLANLTQNNFVGKIDYGNRETQIINFSFKQINKDSSGINFTAEINTSDIRKAIRGIINPATNDIIFQENPTDKIMLNLSDGRAYLKGNKIILESINVNQYWRLVKYNN